MRCSTAPSDTVQEVRWVGKDPSYLNLPNKQPDLTQPSPTLPQPIPPPHATLSKKSRRSDSLSPVSQAILKPAGGEPMQTSYGEPLVDADKGATGGRGICTGIYTSGEPDGEKEVKEVQSSSVTTQSLQMAAGRQRG